MVKDKEKMEQLHAKIEALHQTLAEKNFLIEKLEEELESLQLKLHALLRAKYGRKSEKNQPPDPDEPQASVALDEAEATAPLGEAAAISIATDAALADGTKDELTCDESLVAEAGSQKPQVKRGRKRLPCELPRVETIYDIEEADKICACGCALTHIGDDKSEQFHFIPSRLEIKVHVKRKYACRQCQGNVKVAEMPAQPIPKSIASPGLLAHILIAKFEDHLPLYRQEKILQRDAVVEISRGTLARWVVQCGRLLEPLVNCLQDQIIEGEIAYSDETTAQVLKEPARKPEQKSYVWCFIGGETNHWPH